MFPPRPRLSAGEWQFYLAAALWALIGAGLSCTITLKLSAPVFGLDVMDPFTIWALLAGATGATTGFASTYSRWFGHAGATGWIRAIVGGVILSLVASIVGGTLILPYYGTMFGPFQVIIIMIAYPGLGLVWLAAIAIAHRLMMPWHMERESIFNTRYHEPLV